MSETKEPDIINETPEERQLRLKKQRLKRERMRQRRKKALLMRAGLGAGVLILVIIIIMVIVSAVRGSSDKKAKEKAEAETTPAVEEELEAVDVHQVLHLSFLSLIADPEAAFLQEDTQAAEALDQSHVTVEEFNQILQQLYDDGYVLVSLKDFAVQSEENGLLAETKLMLPKGKKPLIISQQNVNYDLELSGQGLASKVILDESGEITCEMIQSDGTAVTGAYDVIPCVDAFIEQHPDFSHDGARGILGITGYNGILGYRTEAALAATDNNKYASKYGVFDTAKEIEDAAPVVAALTAEGWEFACNGYGKTSYSSKLEDIKADMESWKANVESIIGESSILMYPYGSDIGSWDNYSEENEKYTYLKNQGFQYFCAMDVTGGWIQIADGYVRCNYQNLDGYRMYQDIYQGAARFADVLDFTSVYDQNRPSVPETEEESEENPEEQE
ncbi:MAG: polysaccharide deacetylase [Clostridia bacterium]|nr:polysaccharide deacetylase [Clostridia bacterium]NCC44318.1 polysaccharide deacetylase [Clostridia bacterium]